MNHKAFRQFSVSLSLIALTGAPLARAAEQTTEQTSEAVLRASQNPQKPWSLVGNLLAGGGLAQGTVYGENPSGMMAILGAGVSYNTQERWIFEAQAGWSVISLRGKTRFSFPVDINTRAGIGEVNARYQITERFELGPVGLLAFGTDTGLAPSVGSPSETFYVGAKAAYDISSRETVLRLLGQGMVATNLPNRDAWFLLAGLQIGIPTGGSSQSSAPTSLKTATQKAPTEASGAQDELLAAGQALVSQEQAGKVAGSEAAATTPAAVPASAPVPASTASDGKTFAAVEGDGTAQAAGIVAAPIPVQSSPELATSAEIAVAPKAPAEGSVVDTLRITIPARQVFFDTASAKIRPDVRDALKRIGGYLNESKALWNTVEIAGHADSRGTLEYNRKLSRARAKAVEMALIEGGLAKEKIDSQAFGYERPASRESGALGRALNRRVDLTLRNVLNAEEIRARIDELTENL